MLTHQSDEENKLNNSAKLRVFKGKITGTQTF